MRLSITSSQIGVVSLLGNISGATNTSKHSWTFLQPLASAKHKFYLKLTWNHLIGSKWVKSWSSQPSCNQDKDLPWFWLESDLNLTWKVEFWKWYLKINFSSQVQVTFKSKSRQVLVLIATWLTWSWLDSLGANQVISSQFQVEFTFCWCAPGTPWGNRYVTVARCHRRWVRHLDSSSGDVIGVSMKG